MKPLITINNVIQNSNRRSEMTLTTKMRFKKLIYEYHGSYYNQQPALEEPIYDLCGRLLDCSDVIDPEAVYMLINTMDIYPESSYGQYTYGGIAHAIRDKIDQWKSLSLYVSQT